jgi:hypothetical protein
MKIAAILAAISIAAAPPAGEKIGTSPSLDAAGRNHVFRQ